MTLHLNKAATNLDDRMVLFIPTYKRASAQYTWKAIPPVWKERTILVAPESDLNSLRFYVPEANILIQPPEITTIAAKRAWIIQQCKAPSLVMMDDDLVFSVRKDSSSPSLRPADQTDLVQVFEGLENALDKYAHAGISCRQGNNRTEAGWHDVKRMIYLFGFNTHIAQEHLTHGRVACREDMDYTLQLLIKGFPNTVNFSAAVDQKQFDAPGGCKEERSMEFSNEQAEMLAHLYPGFVKVVDKDYKASVPRKEVIVQWKKAFEWGCEQFGGPRYVGA